MLLLDLGRDCLGLGFFLNEKVTGDGTASDLIPGSAQRRWKVTNQDRVRGRYQYSSAEQESTGEWGVWDISHDERKRLNEKHWPKTFGRILFGFGMTEDEAWADAVRTIEKREGMRFPLCK